MTTKFDKRMELWNLHSEKAKAVEERAIQLIEVGKFPLRWMAAQEDDGEPIGIGFVRGDGFAFISYDDFDKPIEDLALDCAAQILGFPIGSEQDNQRRYDFWNEVVEDAQKQLKELESRLSKFQVARHQAQLKLKTGTNND